nr:hypothetical protein [Bemisia tabaci]
MGVNIAGGFSVVNLVLILQLSGISGNTYGSERSSFSRDAHLLDSDSVAQKVSHVIWKDAAACPISAAFAQISRLNNRESVENALRKALSTDSSVIVKSKADGVRDVICEAAKKFSEQVESLKKSIEVTNDDPWNNDENFEDALENLKKDKSQVDFRKVAEGVNTRNSGYRLSDVKRSAYNKLSAVRNAFRREIYQIQHSADSAVNVLREGTRALQTVKRALAVGQKLGCFGETMREKQNPAESTQSEEDLGNVIGLSEPVSSPNSRNPAKSTLSEEDLGNVIGPFEAVSSPNSRNPVKSTLSEEDLGNVIGPFEPVSSPNSRNPVKTTLSEEDLGNVIGPFEPVSSPNSSRRVAPDRIMVSSSPPTPSRGQAFFTPFVFSGRIRDSSRVNFSKVSQPPMAKKLVPSEPKKEEPRLFVPHPLHFDG